MYCFVLFYAQMFSILFSIFNMPDGLTFDQ